RDHLPGRDRPRRAVASGQVPQGGRGEDRTSHRRDRRARGRRPDRGGDEPRHRGRRAARRVPRRPVPATVGRGHPDHGTARVRGEDAVVLARTFLEQASRRYAAPRRPLSPAAEDAIRHHAWRGNVRELQSVMERVVLFTDSDPVTADDLGLATPAAPGVVGAAPGGAVRIDFPDTGLSLEAVERALLVAALERAGGNQTKAARLLAVSRDTLRYRIEKYGLGE